MKAEKEKPSYHKVALVRMKVPSPSQGVEVLVVVVVRFVTGGRHNKFY